MGAEASAPTATQTETRGAPVTLHVYGLFKNQVGAKLNEVLSHFSAGAFHVGVEVYGREWSYGATYPGIFSIAPKKHLGHSYLESIPLGYTTKTETEVMALLKQLVRDNWDCNQYDMLRHNCVNFSDEFCRHLGVSPIPQHISSLAGMGASIADASLGVLLGRGSPDHKGEDDNIIQAKYYGRHRTFSDSADGRRKVCC